MSKSVRILVVDDNERWRGFLRTTIGEQLELQIVGEASDGWEGIQQTERLQPDLILLDTGLPKLNGIEAARRIREISPTSKILFMSENRSPDIVEEGLSTGAGGYVVKPDAGRELLPAVKAVLEGKRFVSASLAGRHVSTRNEPVARHDERIRIAPLTPGKVGIVGHHEVVFHSNNGQFLDHVMKFIGDALKAGDAAIVMATESHRASLLARLQAYGVNVGKAVVQDRYIALDAADALSTFMINDMPDAVQFMEIFRGLIGRVSSVSDGEHRRVAVFGECVGILLERGNTEAAMQMEKLGSQLATLYNVDILCGYSLSGIQQGMYSETFQRICAEHSAVHSY